MPDVDEKLTFEVLKKVQQRLHRAEQRIVVVESELSAYREHQISVLKDLHRIYDLLGQHQARLGATGSMSAGAGRRRDDDWQ